MRTNSSRVSCYIGTAAAREADKQTEQRSARRRAKSVLALVVMGALLVSGCSASSPFGMFGGGDDDDVPTGSIAKKPVSLLSSEMSEEDWRRAKSALSVALDPQGNGSSASWDNAESRMKGSFTPVGIPVVRGDDICRAFIASVIGNSGQTWLQGSACRAKGEDWAIKDIKPWKKPG